jgi:hypothetical protein
VSLRSWLALALCGASLLAACGGDSKQSSQDVTTPPLTVPQQATGPSSSATDTTATTDSTTDTTASPDAPLDQANPGSNDTPPKPGSPADRFEQFCAQNPGAC